MELGKAKALVAKKAKDNNVDVQKIWDLFFFENFLHRLSISKYKNNFVFKGGFLLETILGVSTRSTTDIDLKLQHMEINNENLKTVLEGITTAINDDNISYSILSIDDLKAETRYGGKTIAIEAKFFNIKKRFNIDIGIGDVVTPEVEEFEFKKFDNTSFLINRYTIETILAEKFETFISRNVNNSRTKDLIDMYLLVNKANKELLHAAIINTFNNRGTLIDKEYMKDTIEKVFNIERTKILFDNYLRKHSFASGISLDKCKEAIKKIYGAIRFKNKILLKNYNIELHIIRHGESESDIVGGWSDLHLSENGINEINNLSQYLDSNYDLFISSDLMRCKETSEILNRKLNNKIVYDAHFREINNGDYKNMLKSTFVKNKYKKFVNLEMDEKYGNGESPKEFYKRIKESFFELIKNNANKKILLVSHEGVITIIECLLNGYDYSNKIKNITGANLKEYK